MTTNMQVHILLVSLMGFLVMGRHRISTTIKKNGKENFLEIFGHKLRVQRSVKSHNRSHEHSHRKQRKRNASQPIQQCPPPLTRLPDDACMVDPCQSDSECTNLEQKCCYNGCMYACVKILRPPPLIDWKTRTSETNNINRGEGLEEPDEYEGNLEFDIMPGDLLIQSHHGAATDEICSTSAEDGDAPMECPHGYECHIEDQGNPLEGIPNRGSCIAINENAPEDMSALEDDYFYY